MCAYAVVYRANTHGHLEFTGQKNGGGGGSLHGEGVCVNVCMTFKTYKIVKNGGRAFTWRWVLTQDTAVCTMHMRLDNCALNQDVIRCISKSD